MSATSPIIQDKHRRLVYLREQRHLVVIDQQRCDIVRTLGRFKMKPRAPHALQKAAKGLPAGSSANIGASDNGTDGSAMVSTLVLPNKQLFDELCHTFINEAQIVFCTLSGAGLELLSNLKQGFDAMIIGTFTRILGSSLSLPLSPALFLSPLSLLLSS